MNQQLSELIERHALDDALGLAARLPADSEVRLDGYRQLARALMAAGRFAEAAPLLDEAEKLRPKQAWVDHLRAGIAASRGDVAAHLRHLALAFALEPASPEMAAVYLAALAHAGLHDEAAQTQREHQDHLAFAHDRLPVWLEPESLRRDGDNAALRGIRLYLDLLEKSVANWIYSDAGNNLGQLLPFSEQARETGRDIPSQAHSMIGLRRLRHLRVVAEQAITEGVAGDFVETGVWRGGACILLAGVLRARNVHDRRVVVADSFAGLPPPDPRYPKDELSAFDFHLRPELAVSLEQVRSNFERYDLLDERIVFLEGYFRDTLPAYHHGEIAILRMDGDLYSSTMDALVHLYPRVCRGGWVICDDYGVVIDARRAVLDYRRQNGISEPMHAVDGDAVVWRKA